MDLGNGRRTLLASVWLAGAALVAACGAGPAATGTPAASGPVGGSPSSSPGITPDGSGAPSGSGAIGGSSGAEAVVGPLLGAIEAAGADVRVIGPFSTEPLGGDGIALCVDAQQVQVYVFPSPEASQAFADQVDPEDPSSIGTTMVSWSGDPRFWRSERLIVLYLGKDVAVDAGLRANLGTPFASGKGASLLPVKTDC
jgi:hypothetical protein